MRQIVKGAEPASLTTHSHTSHCDYDNYGPKGDLRYALVTEQRGLCCYCMGRIRTGSTTMKIEHWQCQSRFPDEQLKYRNLLGACLGGIGQPLRLQHCDTRKGDSDFMYNPAEAAHHIQTRVKYEMDGSIHSNDAEFNGQLDQVLNLNHPLLKSNRRGSLDAVLDWWSREKDRIGGSVPRQLIVKKRDEHVSGTGQIAAYCPVAVWWLEQKLAGMAV